MTNWDQVHIHTSDEWLLSLLSTGLTFAFVALALLALRLPWSSAATPLQLLGSQRERRKLRRLVLPDTCIERVDMAERRLSLLEEENLQSLIQRRDWSALYEQTKHLGAKAYGTMVSMTMGKPEAWWMVHQVKQEGLEEMDLKPVVVFVNTRSGGQQGMKVLNEMQAYLHIAQLVDLQREGPEAALRWWEKTTLRYRILVCGGDGTVGWVLGALEQLDLSYIPPLAILPLGTGNDLARTFGWGGGYTGSSVLPLLQQVGRAHVELLDRWTVASRSVEDKRPSFLPGGSQPPRERKTLTMSNYFGIGVDAAVALDFHQMRERRPEWFWSRLVNKLWYFRSGYINWMGKTCANIGSKIEVICDGEAVDIPPSLEGVIILNIPSFGGGSDLWGRAEDEETEQCESDSDSTAPSVSSVNWNSSGAPRRQSMQDGQLEVVGVHGALQLGASQVGLYKAQRLAQGSHIKVTTKVALPTEVDGEPSWFAKDGVIEISHRGQAFMLVNSKETSHAVATDVVDWALHHKIINLEQRHRMLKEIAQRAGARKPNSWTRLSPPD
ncbi:unnamed protein product [Durusdinium trenchii]|uniref:Diacylglycerol kinase n=1 Tax=Durusdinium trenchii TaxID=1381693 RepID=A0ABP0N4J6_9DINO